MTAVLDLHSDAGHPAVRGLREVHDLLDHLIQGRAAAEPLASAEYAAVVAECDRAVSRLAALKLKLVAAADRAEVALDAGMSGTGAWLALHTRSGSADAVRAVRLAAALEDGLTATAAALDAGDLSPAHAAVIAHAAERLPQTLTAQQREVVEASLVTRARRLDPVRLRKVARRALAAVEADGAAVDAHEDALLRDEEAAAREKTRLTMRDNADGTVSGHFTVPTLAGAILRKTIQQLASPRRGRLGASVAHAGPHGERLSWEHRNGAAFVELLEHLPTDRLHGKVAATVVVTLDHTKLAAAVGAAGLDTGELLSAGETRRIACQAGILPAVLDGASQVLDLGRSQRFFTEAQRVALATTYTECAADGCDRPYSWTELHHVNRWADGGHTDLKDAVPLCGFHHQRIHDRGFAHRWTPDADKGVRRAVTFHRRT